MDPAAVAILRRRIAGARVLREHLVWEALRGLPSLGHLRENANALARFRRLMDRDDLDGAIMLLSASCTPGLELTHSRWACGIWTCGFAKAGTGNRRRRIHTAHHPDRPAALMAALVDAHLDAHSRARSTPGPVAPDERKSKDA